MNAKVSIPSEHACMHVTQTDESFILCMQVTLDVVQGHACMLVTQTRPGEVSLHPTRPDPRLPYKSVMTRPVPDPCGHTDPSPMHACM